MFARAMVLVLFSAALFACGPKLVRTPVHSSDYTRVFLRHTLENGTPVDRGYDHPVEISEVRLTHILASLTWEDPDGKRVPTIRTAHVFDLAEGLHEALQQAGPADEAVGIAFMVDRKLGIFTAERTTSFRAHREGHELVIEFWGIEEDVEEEPGKRTSEWYDAPSELPESPLRGRIIPGEAQTRHGTRGIVVEWRNEYFRRPTALKMRDGIAKRRTVLLEESLEDAPADEPGVPEPKAARVVEKQLRALDRLDAERRSGAITEREYQQRRRKILEGRVAPPEGAP